MSRLMLVHAVAAMSLLYAAVPPCGSADPDHPEAGSFAAVSGENNFVVTAQYSSSWVNPQVSSNQTAASSGSSVNPQLFDDVTRCVPVVLPGGSSVDGAYSCVLSNGDYEAGFSIVDPDTGEEISVPPQPFWFSASDFQSLPINPGTVSVPVPQWIIYAELPVGADTSEQVLTTVVMGNTVEVRAIPESFSWDFHNGQNPVVTSEVSPPYPNNTVVAVYEDVMESVNVTLTTTWRGEWRIAGTEQWLPVTGRATTTAESAPFLIFEAPARLIPTS